MPLVTASTAAAAPSAAPSSASPAASAAGSASGVGPAGPTRSAAGPSRDARALAFGGRLGLFAVGAWTFGSGLMFAVAALNFTTIDRLLDESPSAPFTAHLEALGRPALRDLLRYLSSELNRLYFLAWNWSQLGLGALALLSCRGEPSLGRVRLGLWTMTLTVLVMLFPLTPWITSVGRSLDFLPREPAPPQLREFWTLHAVYTVLDLAKMGLGVAVAVGLGRSLSGLRRSPPTASPGGDAE